jgi:UDP-N-acetylmuramoyl-L-alanyl-D-glutamate--2,6-diaminopimelate ligase
MKLKKLLKEIPSLQIRGSKELEISGVCANSKLVAPGNLFIARKGRTSDGAAYIPEAVAAGASAILTDIYDPLLNKSVAQLIHPDTSSIEGTVAANYYGFPSKELLMVGITGTNGKTTSSFLIKHLLDSLIGPTGLIGTIEYIIGAHRFQAVRTTPDAASVQKMLREMLNQECRNAVMEVTSHALDQHRVDCIDFDIAVFTNLSLDHLDYHRDMEQYALAKNKLFRSLIPSEKKKGFLGTKTAILNQDSPWSNKIAAGCTARLLTYGISTPADLTAANIQFGLDRTSFTLHWQGKKAILSSPFIGRFNVYNCLAAASVGLALELPLDTIAETLSTAPHVAGRLEAVPNPLGLKIYVDFAHSDDALLNVLECLKEFKKGRVITVFGCGGNRDATKRPKMAKVCEEHSDLVIVTSDNPRNEDPQEIIRQIFTGFAHPEKHIAEPDRNAAIKKAVEMATAEDILLIAGKGHEPYQIFAHHTIEFDDRKVALQHARARFLHSNPEK